MKTINDSNDHSAPILDLQTYCPDAVIVAAGEFPCRECLQSWMERTTFSVCCDGAIKRLHDIGIVPDLIIGDGDSIPADLAERYAGIFIRVSEQETNDLTKAVRWLCEHGRRNLVILGGTGCREDHALGNISLLAHYLQHSIFAVMVSDYGMFIPCHGDTSIRAHKGQQVSIFNYNASHISSPDVKYPLPQLTMLWQGTLNEATADTLRFTADGYYLIYLANP